MLPQLCSIHQVDLPHHIIDISAGAYYSLAHSSNGIWVWGKLLLDSQSKQSIQQINQQEGSKPEYIQIDANYSDAGTKHVFAWSDQQVYCWGSNIVYQLGLQQERQYDPTVSSIFSEALEAGIKIKQISCGDSHTLAILKVQQQNSEVVYQLFGWGDSRNYQLALDSTAIIPYPVQIQIPDIPIKKVYSQSDYNVLLSESGECYSWGSNIFGRLGYSGTIKHHKIPTCIPVVKNIQTISIGKYHCVAVSYDKLGYSWGHGMQGQLGINQIVSESSPKQLDIQYLIVNVSCGDYHTIVLGEDNNIYSCGTNAYDGLGHNQTDHKKRCLKLTKIKYQFGGSIIKIMSGNRHNLALNESGQVYSWGNNKYNQLGPFKAPQRFKNKQQKTNRYQCLQINKVQNNKETIIEYKNGKNNKKIIDKLQNWKQKYTEFKAQKQRQQKQLMEQFDQIMKGFQK